LPPFSASAARIATRLLLGWVLLVVAGVAMAADDATAAGDHAPPSMHGLAFDEPGHADRDDASCSKAPSIQKIHESDIAKAEAEPELSLDSIRHTRCGLAPCMPGALRDAACVARRNTPLGRGPPSLI
jgi:hypothetical protein